MSDNSNLQEMENDLNLYIRVQSKLIRLSAVDKASTLGAIMASRLVLFACLVLMLLFLSVAAALYFARIDNGLVTGFCLIAGVYLVLFLILYLFQQHLITAPVKNKLIRMLQDENN